MSLVRLFPAICCIALTMAACNGSSDNNSGSSGSNPAGPNCIPPNGEILYDIRSIHTGDIDGRGSYLFRVKTGLPMGEMVYIKFRWLDGDWFPWSWRQDIAHCTREIELA